MKEVKPITHGKAGSYNNRGCRCEKCTKAWREYVPKYNATYRKKLQEAGLAINSRKSPRRRGRKSKIVGE